MGSLMSLFAFLVPRGRDCKASSAAGPLSSSSVSLWEVRPQADALEEPTPPAPPCRAALPAAPSTYLTWRNTRQHGTDGQVFCFVFHFVVSSFSFSDWRTFRIAS